jgi:hypothetical protein
VTLDASASSDADHDVLLYTWKEGSTTLATARDPIKTAMVPLAVGTHTITLTVSDGGGGVSSDTLQVVVEDALGAIALDLEQRERDLAAALAANRELARQNEDLTRETTRLSTEISALIEQIRLASEQNRQMADALAHSLALVEQNLRVVFRDPAFTIPGTDAGARLRALIDAIVALNQGRKEGLYVGLGGRPGQR